MADAKKARVAVRRAQADFERAQGAAHEARRKVFKKAQEEGLSLRQIGEEVGLHHTRVGQILRGE
jgi:DNA-directed RNA polymerase specialized sigma24 family protein